jgi:hypothetical protein
MKMELKKFASEFFLFHPTEGNIGTSIDFGRGSYLIDREHVYGLTTEFYQKTGIYKNDWDVLVEMDGDNPKISDRYLKILEIIS